MAKAYATPMAFDRALKKAAKAAGDTSGSVYRQALRDRFLCRVFCGGNGEFVLKGGSGILARIPSARATRDLDFATQRPVSADKALSEMKRIAEIDLGDWCTFRLTRCVESIDDNGYSRLLKLRFATFVGDEEKDPILIDLSLDCTTTLPPERVIPANRLDIAGLEACDYLAYSLPDQIADKFCAIMERQPNGYPSSRMKDLVDVVACTTNMAFDLDQIRVAIISECAKRGMNVPEEFTAPTDWKPRFDGFARESGLPEEYASFERATSLAKRFFGPALCVSQTNRQWIPERLEWE